MLKRPAAYVLLAVSLSGCIGADVRSADFTSRDSIGVQIVESRRPAWREGQVWSLSAEPTLSIGVLEGAPEYHLFHVVGAHRLPDGRIAIANAGTHEIRFYDADARFLHAAGGYGGGPGEFLRLVATVRSEDTLFAYDLMQPRMSVFDGDGTFLRSFSLSGAETGLPSSPVGRFGDGSWVATRSQQFNPSSGLVRDSAIYFRVWEEVRDPEPIGRFLGGESIVQPVNASHSGYYFRHVPYGRRSRAIASGRHLVYGSSDTYELAVYSMDGRLEKLIRRAHTPEPATGADLHAWEVADEAFRSSLASDAPAMLRQPASELPRPPTKAAHGEIRLDVAENLWVAEYAFPRHTPTAWSVFDSDGRWLGQVAVPENFRVLEIGEDYVLGVHRDGLEVESVRMYSLLKHR